MPLSSIVVIVIRLFALNWLLTAVPLLLSAAARPSGHDRSVAPVLIIYAPPVLLAILSATFWILAPAVARLVSRGVDSTVNPGGLSRSDLYSFAFVFLGLFFILSSFADVINWIHYFSAVSREDPRHDPRVQNLYQLTRPCLTLALGLISLLGAPVGPGSSLPMTKKAKMCKHATERAMSEFAIGLSAYLSSTLCLGG